MLKCLCDLSAFVVKNSFAVEKENKREPSVKLCVFSVNLCEIAFNYLHSGEFREAMPLL
jgi:hypothetical protein